MNLSPQTQDRLWELFNRESRVSYGELSLELNGEAKIGELVAEGLLHEGGNLTHHYIPTIAFLQFLAGSPSRDSGTPSAPALHAGESAD